jgi:hypothetical protein
VFHFSPNIIRMFKSKRMRWVTHVARIYILGQKPNDRNFGRPRSRWENNCMLKLICKKKDGMVRTQYSFLSG